MSERPEVYERLSQVMNEVKAIIKSRKNPEQGYSYRGIDDAYNALQPLLAKHGVVCVPHLISYEREERKSRRGGVLTSTIARLRYTFYAPDGSSVQAELLGEGMDSGDKSANKAMSQAQKYALLQVFMVPTDEPKDSETESPEPMAREEERQQKVYDRAVKALRNAQTIDAAEKVHHWLTEKEPDVWELVTKEYDDAVGRLQEQEDGQEARQ